MENSNLTLFNINETTLRLWFKNKTRREEIINLLQGRDFPGELSCVSGLPAPRAPHDNLQGISEKVSFSEPGDCSGMAKLTFRKRKSNLLSSASPSHVNTKAILPPIQAPQPYIQELLISTLYDLW